MRILLLCPMPPDPAGPGAIPRVLSALLEGLRQQHEVTLVCVAGPEAWELEAADRLEADDPTARIVRRHPSPPVASRWGRRGRLAGDWGVRRLPWRTAWFRERRIQRIIDALVVPGRFDVIAVEDNAMGVYRYPSHVPVVLTEHEVRLPRMPRLPRVALRRWPGAVLSEVDWHRWPRYQRRVWGRADIIQTFTAEDAAAIARLQPSLGAKVRVNPFGIHAVDLPAPQRERPGAVLFVGNYTHFPNVEAARRLAHEVMPRLQSAGVSAHLTLAGAHPPPEIERLAGPDIEVTGWVPDLRPLLAAAQVVLAPVHVGGGMRMKVLEAMANGKAVITTGRGARGFTHDEDAETAPPLLIAESAEETATATARLLSQAADRRELGLRAHQFVVAHHGIDAYARRLASVYTEAASEAARRR